MLKGNQGTVHEEVKLFFTWAQQRQFAEIPHSCYRTVDGEHGRIEERRYWLSSEIEWVVKATAWPGLRSIGMVEVHRTLGEETAVERRYYLTSLAGTAEQFAQAARGH